MRRQGARETVLGVNENGTHVRALRTLLRSACTAQKKQSNELHDNVFAAVTQGFKNFTHISLTSPVRHAPSHGTFRTI